MKKRYKSCLRAAIACLSCAGILLSATSCGTPVWKWLWERETVMTADPDELTVDQSPVDDMFANAVEYTGEAYEGTEILYEGIGKNRDCVIVIDAGHQQKAWNEKEPLGPYPDGTAEKDIAMKTKVSSGSENSYTTEHALNLKVALLLRNKLIGDGYSVVMIRETANVNISNRERAQIANKYNAAAYIRIHANGYDDESVRGVETLCQTASNPFPSCAAMYADSRALSEYVLDSYCDVTGFPKRSVFETDEMTGINWSRVPSTIIELGYMTNPEEAELMNEADFAIKAAMGISEGIKAYLADKAGN